MSKLAELIDDFAFRYTAEVHTKLQDEIARVEGLDNINAGLVEVLGDLISLYDQRAPLRERPTTWEAARAALASAKAQKAVRVPEGGV